MRGIWNQKRTASCEQPVAEGRLRAGYSGAKSVDESIRGPGSRRELTGPLPRARNCRRIAALLLCAAIPVGSAIAAPAHDAGHDADLPMGRQPTRPHRLEQPFAQQTLEIAAASALAPSDETIAGPFSAAVGLAFDKLGQMFVWERTGLVWSVPTDGTPAQLMLDISEEVAAWGDHGLLGLALDPDFELNGWIYLLYSVDYHHLTLFGTPFYDPDVSDNGVDTQGRITRYALVDPAQPQLGVDPASRQIILGDSIGSGIPLCSDTHGVGALVFGEDGSLLISTGEGTAIGPLNNCLPDGIIQPKEDVGSWRSQLLDSLNGKVLRIDRNTGDGLASNPYYDALEPRAPRSRVWSVGLRQPFRMTLRPGSGDRSPAAGDPGTLYLGDVGQGTWEELNVITGPGINLGWPYWEGPEILNYYVVNQVYGNLDAPNPLFGLNIPGIGLCNDAYFLFQDLIVDENIIAGDWPNPCDPSQQIPAPLRSMQKRPLLSWEHLGGAWTTEFDPSGAAQALSLASPDSPVVGDNFFGNCSLAGTWYTSGEFPVEYHGTYFHADFGEGWIRNLVFGGDEELLEIREFATGVGAITSMAVNPADGALYYVDLTDADVGFESTVHRIRFTANAAPNALLSPEVAYGPAPLTVSFQGQASNDPEGAELEFDWDFGDGTPHSRLPNPVRSFPSVDITAQGTIIAKLFGLGPNSVAFPGDIPFVLRDGDMPPAGTTDPARQFQTAHLNPSGQSLKNGLDWIGYSFGLEREIVGVIFQQGIHQSAFGGWFEDFRVQVRVSGQWTDVIEEIRQPVFGALGDETYTVYEIRFEPTMGSAVRLIGTPGGPLEFISLGELRVLARPLAPVVAPTNYNVTMRVKDDTGQESVRPALVSINNSPPVVNIVHPKNGDVFNNTTQETIQLVVNAVDAEHLLSEMECEWRVLLQHDNHVHPEPPDAECLSEVVLFPHGTMGDTLYYEFHFTLTDPLGLSGTQVHFLAPDDDCNLNGINDTAEILSGLVSDRDNDGLPDNCQRDCNQDGLSNAFELGAGFDSDCNANGIPDLCENFIDCDGDGIPDPCAVLLHGVKDLNGNGIPDSCELEQGPKAGL